MRGREWTSEEDDFMRAHYPRESSNEVARKLRRSVVAVYGRAGILELKKTEEYHDATQKRLAMQLAESGKEHRFSKGHTPANKGQKMPDHVYERAKVTMFKKGHVPVNHKPVGYERITRDGYVEVKVAEPNKFVLKHRLIWEQVNGLIPEGYNVQFRDGNRQNFSLENLYLINRVEQFKNVNCMYARYPKEVQLAIQAKAALQRQINKFKRNE